MCGITGFFDICGQIATERIGSVVEQMSSALHHRGPDDSGIWVDGESGIGLGHKRLAVIDISPEGHQPMISADGRYVIVFNGEIYNFLELRRQLENLGHHFRGHSDTEVMLASFSQWGVNKAVKLFNGMFAFALWDVNERVLHLGRDRLGEKPLYYGWLGNTFVFASELKALKAHPDFHPEINRDALALFLRHNYIPAPYSIYKGIYKLPPATLLCWNGQTAHPQPVPYWFAKEVAPSGVTHPFTGSESEAVEQLEALLKDAVAIRTIADVPLGAFLSGGIDSSTIVALMQAQSSQSVKTFSIGFYEDKYNEAQHALAVARYLGTDHKEFYVTPQDALTVIPKLPSLYDEPFSDPSQIPTFLVSQLARQYVTVSLTGDAGDELFGGYKRYWLCRSIWQKVGWMPQIIRHIAAHALSGISSRTWDLGFVTFGAVLPAKLRQQGSYGDKLHTLSEILAAPNSEAMYADFISHWKKPEQVVLGCSEPLTTLCDRQSWLKLPDFSQRMMYQDMVSYLPDDILVKVDRSSMGVSLEGRIPLLDHRVVEFAWRLPLSMKIRNGQGKWLLRQVLYKYVPQKLIERPKMGFSVPLDSWLRGSLREWTEDLLNESRLHQQGFLNPQPIRQKWTEHLTGDRNWQYHLWNVLMFQAWLDKNY
ncbi:MAG: asparagine synthase (glutamine-hydrolyzing) [Scytonema sp. PMC 1069.18]|nr:asparagine synthase (glutamine-hydrolyzing) [Scytonema sp. PMC 1069.18]MEC4882919.1 asparagine synthase (glutamine-hydrolyzing) [Scytonema sp. PMC 1070.18]